MVIDFGGRLTTKMVVVPLLFWGQATTILGADYYDYVGRNHDYEAGRGELIFLEASS